MPKIDEAVLIGMKMNARTVTAGFEWLVDGTGGDQVQRGKLTCDGVLAFADCQSRLLVLVLLLPRVDADLDLL